MTDLLIKAPDGRIVVCPRHLTITTVADDRAVDSVNVAALKPGWSVVVDAPPVTEAPAIAAAPITIDHDGWAVEEA